MPRKVVRVYIPKELKEVLEVLSRKLGLDESEVMRIAFFELAKEVSLITQKVHA